MKLEGSHCTPYYTHTYHVIITQCTETTCNNLNNIAIQQQVDKGEATLIVKGSL